MSKKNNILSFPDATGTVSIMSLAKQIDELKNEQTKIYEMAAKSILKALDYKDKYTFGHSMRVCYFSLVLGRQMGLSKEELYELQLSAIFHDIGKIGTPDEILNKPTRLTEEEFKIMKEHPENSYRILKDFAGWEKISINTRHHHERYDGYGYPSRLKGDDIPLMARIILIADTFDAMTSTRSYRKGLSYKVTFEELEQFSGSQFDPALVTFFIAGMAKEEKRNEKKFYIPLMDRLFDKDAA